MHIAIASTEFVTELTFAGGLANYSANLARLLRKHGHDVSVFVISSVNEEFIWDDGIKIYRVCYNDHQPKIEKIKVEIFRRCVQVLWNLTGRSFVINKKIKEINQKKKIDIVHFCNASSLSLLRSKKIPAVVRLSHYRPIIHDAEMPVFDYEKSINNLDLIDRIQFAATKRADAIFAPSYNIARLTEQKIKRKVHVIESPFLIDTDKVDDTLYEQKLYGKKYFIFYGTLS